MEFTFEELNLFCFFTKNEEHACLCFMQTQGNIAKWRKKEGDKVSSLTNWYRIRVIRSLHFWFSIYHLCPPKDDEKSTLEFCPLNSEGCL